MIKTKYVLRSNRNGKYLSHLFEDDHDLMFQCSYLERERESYRYDIKRVAESIARQCDATVVRLRRALVIYLSYRNNFITVERASEYMGISKPSLSRIIRVYRSSDKPLIEV